MTTQADHPISTSTPRLGRYLIDLWSRREFAWFMAVGNLRAQHASTALGIFWYVLNPIILAAIYFLVFGFIFAGSRRGDPQYLAYLVAGTFCFSYTRGTLISAAKSITGNSSLITAVRFPRLLLPISSLIEAAIGFAVSIVIFYAIVTPIAGLTPDLTILILGPAFALHTLWNLGLGALSARLTVPFRDFGNILPFMTRIWFYVSPILWTLDRLETQAEITVLLVKLNPMFYFLSVYRSALMGTEFVPSHLGIAAAVTLVTLVVGVREFRRFEGEITHHL